LGQKISNATNAFTPAYKSIWIFVQSNKLIYYTHENRLTQFSKTQIQICFATNSL